jgi:hypothetical protein
MLVTAHAWETWARALRDVDELGRWRVREHAPDIETASAELSATIAPVRKIRLGRLAPRAVTRVAPHLDRLRVRLARCRFSEWHVPSRSAVRMWEKRFSSAPANIASAAAKRAAIIAGDIAGKSSLGGIAVSAKDVARGKRITETSQKGTPTRISKSSACSATRIPFRGASHSRKLELNLSAGVSLPSAQATAAGRNSSLYRVRRSSHRRQIGGPMFSVRWAQSRRLNNDQLSPLRSITLGYWVASSHRRYRGRHAHQQHTIHVDPPRRA